MSEFLAKADAAAPAAAQAKELTSKFSQLFSSPAAAATAAVAERTRIGAVSSAKASKARKAEEEKEEEEAARPTKKRKLTEEELETRQERTLFVGNVPLPWDKQRLRQAIREALGDKYTGQLRPLWFRAEPLEEKWSHSLRKAGSILGAYAKGASDAKNAYVVLDATEDVRIVSRVLHGFEADSGHVLRADGVGASAKLLIFDRKRSVFVGNLPKDVSEADLRVALAPSGEVDAVRIVRDRVSKECKGFAFVRFKDRWSVKEALNQWGVEIRNRPMRVMKVTDGTEGGDAKQDASNESHPAQLRIQRRFQIKQQKQQRQKAAKARAGINPGKKLKAGEKAKPKNKRTGTKGNKTKVSRPKSKKGKR